MPDVETVDTGPVDVARAANDRIWDFVNRPTNVKLRAGTGYYSTPFRGGLFGESRAADVAKKLATRRVDVLWLGSNPHVPRSLDNITLAPAAGGDFPSFEMQRRSGFFGAWKWDSKGEPEADFNPIESPTPGWRAYRDVLKQVGSLECVAVANLVPWGSQDMATFVTRLGAVDQPLLRRVLEFADDLNAEIVQALAPTLLVVPLSVGRDQRLNAAGCVGLSLDQATDVRPFTLPLTKRVFNFFTAICRRGRLSVRTVFVPHPASLRLSTQSRERLVTDVAAKLRDFRE